MNEQEKDLEKCEQELFEELLTVILFLNNNGIPLDSVREMILMKVDRAFIAYEENKVRDRFRKDFEKWALEILRVIHTMIRPELHTFKFSPKTKSKEDLKLVKDLEQLVKTLDLSKTQLTRKALNNLVALNLDKLN